AAHLLALFDPWPVMGSLRHTTSAIPNTQRPDGSLAIGWRTVGAKRPESTPLESVSVTDLARAYSQGRKRCNNSRLFRRCASRDLTSRQQSIGPPGTPSYTMISQGPLVVSAGKTKYSPTPGMMLKQTAEYPDLGESPRTYVNASARMGRSNCDRTLSRSKI